MTASRLPFAPLAEQLRLQWDAPAVEGVGNLKDVGKSDRASHGLWCDRRAAVILGVRRDDIPRYRKRGLTPRMADRLAIRAGLHPLLLWGDAWSEAEAA